MTRLLQFLKSFLSKLSYLINKPLSREASTNSLCYLKFTYTPPKIEKPPSTQIMAPVTNCEASLNSHTKAPFNSSG